MWEDTLEEIKEAMAKEGYGYSDEFYKKYGRVILMGYKVGEQRVIEWIEDNCIGVDTETDDPEDYMGIQSMAWQKFKQELEAE